MSILIPMSHYKTFAETNNDLPLFMRIPMILNAFWSTK